jgi:acyl transferase domain-containing protein
VDLAAHSAHMDAPGEDLAASLAGIRPGSGSVPIYSTVTGGLLDGARFDAAYWRRNLRETVLFATAVAAACDDGPADFIEIAPHPILRTPLEQLAATGSAVFGSLDRELDERTALLRTAAALHTRGRPLRWSALIPGGARPVPLPGYPWQRRRYWIRSEGRDATPAPPPAPTRPETPPDWEYELVWREAPQPADVRLPGASWLLLDDGAGLAPGLAAAISAAGGTPVVGLAASPAEVETVVANWLADAGEAAGIICVLAGATPADDPAARALEKCAAVAAVARALLMHAAGSQLRLWLLTRAANAIAPGDVPDPVAAAVWGFGLGVALECAPCWGGMIDLPARSDAAADAACVLAQVAAAGAEDQIAVRGGRRFVPRLAPATPHPAAPPAVRAGASYLVTGGLGNVGVELVRWLVSAGARHIVVVSRTPVPPRSDWDRLDPDSPLTRAVAVIRDAEAAGAVVLTVAADVADPAAVRSLLSRFGAELPPLKGVFHAAALTGFVPLVRMTAADIAAILRPKLAGAWLLHRATSALELDHFVLFSSVAAVWGSRGKAHYAAANRAVDALAALRRSSGLPALAVNWGGWAGGQDAAHRFVLVSELRPMPHAAALERLGAAMSAGSRQRVIAAADWRGVQAGYAPGGHRTLFAELVTAAPEAAAAVAGEGTALRARILEAGGAAARGMLLDHVRGRVAEALGMKPSELHETDVGFFRLGMDSRTAVELRSRLEQDLGITLNATVAFEFPTVEALARYLETRLLGPAPDAPAASPATVAGGDPPAAGESDVAQLSEDELARLLDSTVSRLLDDTGAP